MDTMKTVLEVKRPKTPSHFLFRSVPSSQITTSTQSQRVGLWASSSTDGFRPSDASGTLAEIDGTDRTVGSTGHCRNLWSHDFWGFQLEKKRNKNKSRCFLVMTTLELKIWSQIKFGRSKIWTKQRCFQMSWSQLGTSTLKGWPKKGGNLRRTWIPLIPFACPKTESTELKFKLQKTCQIQKKTKH